MTMDFATMKLPAEKRALLRYAIKIHDGWPSYRAQFNAERSTNLDLSSMSKAELLAVASALGIDLAPFTGTTTQQGSDEMNAYSGTPKPRTIGPTSITIVAQAIEQHRTHISIPDHERNKRHLRTLLAPLLPHAAEFLAIPGMNYDDPLIQQPDAWLKSMLAEFGPQIGEAA